MASVPSSGSAPPPPVWNAAPQQAGAVRYAGFWMRVLAAIIDGIVLAVISEIIAFFFPTPPLAMLDVDDMNAERFIEIAEAAMPWGRVLLTSIVVWAYFAFQESSSARGTLGKRALGIRVSTADGSQLSLGMASLRAWPMYLPNAAWLVGFGVASLVSFAGFIACIAVAFSMRKQGLHDKMAGALLTRS